MVLTEVGVGKTRNDRKLTERAVSKGVRAVAAKVVAKADAQTNRSPGNVAPAANGANHIPVTVWGPDGSCFEGMCPQVTGELIFVESKQLLPVETEVTIRFTPPNEDLVNRGVVKGIVVWQCLSSDHFKNRKGFGVCLQGRWPQSPGPTGNDGSEEAA